MVKVRELKGELGFLALALSVHFNHSWEPHGESGTNTVMAGVVLLQARWRRKCRSPLQGAAIDPWAPRREDSRGSEPESWGDFRSLTEAPIARLESLDEMESLSVSS